MLSCDRGCSPTRHGETAGRRADGSRRTRPSIDALDTPLTAISSGRRVIAALFEQAGRARLSASPARITGPPRPTEICRQTYTVRLRPTQLRVNKSPRSPTITQRLHRYACAAVRDCGLIPVSARASRLFLWNVSGVQSRVGAGTGRPESGRAVTAAPGSTRHAHGVVPMSRSTG